MGIREKLHDGKRAKEWWGSTGRPLSEAYARRAGGYAKKGGELVLKGSEPYLVRMEKHLKKEHPSTRRRLTYVAPRKNVTRKQMHKLNLRYYRTLMEPIGNNRYLCHQCGATVKGQKGARGHVRFHAQQLKRRYGKLGR